MRPPIDLFPYQQKAIEFQCSHPASALWLDMGLGKSVVTLTSIMHLLNCGTLKSVVIVAPIRVCRLVWRQEALKWSHTADITFSMMVGDKDQRSRALMQKANIYLLNYENLEWFAEVCHTYFVSKGLPLPFDGIVFDEITKCFAAGTPIATEDSALTIDKIKIGDKVVTHLGLRKVTDIMTNKCCMMSIIKLSNGETLHCTQNHPFLLNGEWVAAGSIREGDMLYGRPALNPTLWGRSLRNMQRFLLEAKRSADHLLKNLCECMEDAATRIQNKSNTGWYQGFAETSGRARCMEQRQTVVGRVAVKNERITQMSGLLSPDWWKRLGWFMGRTSIAKSSPVEIHSRVHFQNAVSPGRIPDPLQAGFRRRAQQDSDRDSRTDTHHHVGETKGLKKAGVLGKVRVESALHYESTSDVDVWNITVEDAETYFAGGVLVHNCKNSSTHRVKALRKVLSNFTWRTGLTGSPASNGYKDLHGQYLVLDDGARLGTSKSQFETQWYRKEGPYKKVPYRDTEEGIKHLIGDMTLEMSAEDYNPLPSLIVNEVTVELPKDLRTMYDKMEREFFIKLDSGVEVEVFNQASLTNKLLQFSNGAMYPIAGMPLWEPIHSLKLEALEDIIEEANGQPILCAYAYISDAERIMSKFRELRPINLTDCKSERLLVDAMRRWKNGDCRLMIGHPACLGADTQVLTERNGWISIVDVEQTDRVFDGIEFVSHDGCSYSGHKEVIDLFGISMTPDHKLMIDGEWKEAKNVQDSGEVRKAAIQLGNETAHLGVSGMPELWGCDGDASPKCDEVQPRRKTALSEMQIPPHDRNSYLENLAGFGVESARHTGQKLRRAWNNCLPRVVGFQRILRRYVTELFGRIDNRARGCESALLQGELCVGDQHGSASQQANQSQGGISGGGNPLGRIGQAVGYQQDHAGDATQQGNDRGSSGNGRIELKIRKKSAPCEHQTPRKAHVYDLVSCGPRHRFLIRNARGEVFISHNSMGHGLDGLQDAGYTLVWYGLNWSLDLYDQFNARIRRQGQGHPVICHRILCHNTLDQAQALALDEKASTQSGLRKAIKQYRESRK